MILGKEQLLANIRLKSSNTLPFRAPIGCKWANVIVFYLCYGTSAPFNLAFYSSNSKAEALSFYYNYPSDLISPLNVFNLI